MSQLTNQTAVITGAGRGIGRAIALKFATEGADVVCVSRTAENSDKVANEIRALGRKAWAYAVDVADSVAVETVAEKILAECGKVDIVVNNAGVTRDGLLIAHERRGLGYGLEHEPQRRFSRYEGFSRAMLRQRSGRIINISSISGLVGNAGQCNYAASKAGLIGFTQSAAREFAARGITVNAIAPGFIETDMTAELNEPLRAEVLKRIPLGSFGQAEDIAHAALFLASPARVM
jgi:3-oxoacyl-[acyl-carrier protein] reductase